MSQRAPTWDELGIVIDEGPVGGRSVEAEEAEDEKWIAWAVKASLRARKEGRLRVAEDRERLAKDLLAGIVARYRLFNPYGEHGEA